MTSIIADFAPIWAPIALFLALTLVVGLIRGFYKDQHFGRALIKDSRRFFDALARRPFATIGETLGMVMLFWICGVGMIEFGLLLWLIHFKLKADLVEWILSFF